MISIHQDNRIQEILAEGKTVDDFYAVCDLLKDLPEKYKNSSKTKKNNDNTESISFEYLNWNDVNEDYSDIFLDDLLADFEKEMNFSSEPCIDNDNVTNNWSVPQNELVKNDDKLLPVWLCHSRPRVVEEE